MRHLQLPSLLLSLLCACAIPPSNATAPVDLSGEVSVKPGINESWKSDEIDPLIERLEGESREIYTEREAIGAVVNPAVGAVVADVGSGSGFMALIFAKRVGPTGKVYAVDINPSMLGHVASDASERGLANVETVLCTERSVELPAASVDLVFVCDTYHHFEYPMNTLSTIHKSLRKGGQLVIIDFNRVPGVTKDWILNHVRAGQEVVQSEIESAGFELVTEHSLETLGENYILRFKKI